MKTILLIFLCVFAFKAQSQYYIGLKEEQARKSIAEAEDMRDIEKTYNNDGTFTLSWSNTFLKTFHMISFDNKGISYSFCIRPNDQKVLNQCVSMMNSTYVIKSSTEWTIYAAGNVYDVQLSYNSKFDAYLIVYSIIKQ